MGSDAITLRSPAGETRPATADVAYYGAGARVARAVGFVLLGLLGGLACIIVPILHLVTTWALPLVGVLAAVKAWNTHLAVKDAQGACPACEQDVELSAGAGAGQTPTQLCPACGASLELVLPASGAGE